MEITAVAINCSLKNCADPPSSTDRMIGLIADALKPLGVRVSETIRIAEHNILPGVKSDEGPGDAWPDVRTKILAADILIFGTPIWMGQPSSLAKRVCERMDAFLSETDGQGRSPAFGKVAVAAIVGNEDGAHNVTADLFQALNDVGWTIPAQSSCYWVGEAMQSVDFKELKRVPAKVCQTATMLASSTAHLAKLLKAQAYPGVPSHRAG